MINPYADFDFESTKDDLCVCVDMSNEFNNGVLGSDEAMEIMPHAATFLHRFQGKRVYTQDTHGPDYLSTQEGQHLPIIHGQKDTYGWQLAWPIQETVRPLIDTIFEKDTFGCRDLFTYLTANHFENIYFMGRDTGICVISCAVLAKTADPEARIHILSGLCSCVNKQTHNNALAAMKLLQMNII